MKQIAPQELEVLTRSLNQLAEAITKIYPDQKPKLIYDQFDSAALCLLKFLNVE